MTKLKDLEYINKTINVKGTKVLNKESSNLKNNQMITTILSVIGISSGLFLLLTPNVFYQEVILSFLTVSFISYLAFIFVIQPLTVNRTKRFILMILISIISLAIFYPLSFYITFSLRIVTAAIGLVVSFFLFLGVYLKIKSKVSFTKTLVLALLYTTTSILLIYSPIDFKLLVFLYGIYLILFSFSYLFENFRSFTKNVHLKNFIISLPSIILFFLPIALFKDLNSMIREDPEEILKLQEKDSNEDPDLVIYIQARPGIIPGLGHVDMYFNGNVYSFGDYNHKSTYFGGLISDGIAAILAPVIHITYELKDNNKMVLGYGLKLTEEEKEKVQNKLDEVFKDSVKWDPQIKLKDGTFAVLDPSSYVDDGSRIFLSNIAYFYKFKKGSPYYMYCGVVENCAKFINDIVGVTGVKLKTLSNIISPGSYLAYLNRLYKSKDSRVYERRLFTINNDGQPVEYPSKLNGNYKLNNIEVKIK